MGRKIFCRWCQGEEHVVAGLLPTVCKGCGRDARWSTEPGAPLPKRHAKRARVKFDVTQQDYRYFLKRIGVAKD